MLSYDSNVQFDHPKGKDISGSESKAVVQSPICRVPLEKNEWLYLSRGIIKMCFIFYPMGCHGEIIIKVCGSFSLWL